MHAPRLPRLSPLQWALLGSMAAHATLLGLRLGAPAALSRAYQDIPLSVVLVNRAGAAPDTAVQALAQANLDGGGNGAHRGMAASPLPAEVRASPGDAADQQDQDLQQLQQREREVLSSLRSQIVTLQQTAQQAADPQARSQANRQRREMLDLLGAIERRIAQDDAAPRRRFVGPSTRSVPYALYYDRMRQKIERLGTADFPQYGGQKIYGRLIMAITVDAAGHVLRTEVARSSGNPLLDRMAQAIAYGAQPYGRFTPAMLAGADQLVIVAAFDFTRDSGLETDMQAQPGDVPALSSPADSR